MGWFYRTGEVIRPFFYGCFIGCAIVFICTSAIRVGLLDYLIETVYAASGTTRPNANSTTNQGTASGCATASEYTCLDEVETSPTTPANTTTDYLSQLRNNVDFFQMDNSITGVSVVTAITVNVYHKEGSANMLLDVSLFDNGEVTQIGTTQNLTVRTTGTGSWDAANFTSLSLTQTQLDNLRIRLRCTKPGGGAATDCRSFVMYASVTYTPVINVTVSSTGTQQDVDLGFSNRHVGGSFVFTGNVDSRDITSIMITETGTVNASSHLSNVRLYYENAASCASQSYNGTESQYGSATTFNGSNQATFSVGSGVGVTTSSQLCVYAVMDVSSSATAGQTIELEITDPSTQVTGSGSAVVSPSTAITLSGTTNILEENLTQIHYHWRNDDGNETGATSATGGTEDTTYDALPKNQTKRLRMEVSNEGTGVSDATSYVLEFAQKVTTCSAISEATWVGVGDASDAIDMSNSSNVSDGNTTNFGTAANGAVTDENTNFDGVGALRDTTATSGAITLSNLEFTELEYSIVATNSATDGATYCFRVTAGGAALDTYTRYPEATINADLAVAAFGSQTSFVNIPTANVYNGGGFSIIDTTAASAHSVTSVTIHASGTVDLQNDIDNVELWYEFDTTGADSFNCSSEGYGVGGAETQYGSTVAGGFDGTNKVTFTDSIVASTTQSVCLYVVYDVAASSSDGETIEVRINDPSTGIVLDSGSLSPAALVDISGMTTLVKENPKQMHYHWREDDGSETSATSATGGTQDTFLEEMAQNTPYRIRIAVSNEGGATTTAKQYLLEWGQKVSTCSNISTWHDVDDVGDEFEMSPSGNISDGNTTNVASGANGAVTDENTNFDGVGALRDTTALSGSITLSPTEFTELEYAIEATASTTEGASYCFRVTDNGTPLPAADYTVYPESKIKLGTDFVVHRGVSTMTGATLTITNGAEYTLRENDSSRAFIRITNTHHTGAGPGGTGNHNAADVTTYIQNPSNLVTSVTFGRAAFPSGNTRIAWEIVEYIGDVGGENEFIVRSASTATYVAANTTLTTSAVSGIVDDADVVPFITGQWNPNAGRFDYNTGLSSSAWNSGGDTVTFTRGEANGNAVIVSYAVVEFTGSNWQIRRIEHTYTQTTNPESETISPTLNGSINRAFIHTQKRTGSGLDTHANFGHTVWISGLGQIQFKLDANATTPASHASVAWIIENNQTQGKVMKVTRSGNTITSGAPAPLTSNIDITTTLDDITTSSIFTMSSANGTGRTFPEPIIGARLLNSSSTQYELWVGDTTDSVTYRTEVVEWPTASAKLVQNYFRLYNDNDQLTPTSSWAGLAENQPMTALTDPIASGENVRIRMTLNVTAAALPATVDAFQLEYGELVTSCGAIAENDWRELGDIGSTTALWRGHAGATADDATLSSTTISVSDIFGTYEEENDTALTPNTALIGEDIEFDWNVEDNGADDKTSYCFRMTYADGTTLETYTNYPIVRTVGYGPVIGHWRWFDDENSLTPSTPLDGAATNTAPANVANANIIKLRTVLEERSGAAGNNVKFKLQFSEYPDFSVGVQDVVASATCAQTATTSAQLWCYANGAGVDNAIINDNTLSSADTCTAGSGTGCGTHNEGTSTTTATFDHLALAKTEFEFTLTNNGARVGGVYYFRLWDITNNEAVTASTTYPSLAAESASLVFTSTGLSAGTTTEGVVTDVATASTSITFGDLPFDTQYEAAYRLTVNTNSTEGYQVLMVTDQEMENTYGTPIPAIAGSNASPVSWATGCAGLSGCFGYHAGDDSLTAGSARFGADDSYAAIAPGVPQEVAYAAVPVSESHDIVYKIQVSEQQPAGDYGMGVSFIVSPVY